MRLTKVEEKNFCQLCSTSISCCRVYNLSGAFLFSLMFPLQFEIYDSYEWFIKVWPTLTFLSSISSFFMVLWLLFRALDFHDINFIITFVVECLLVLVYSFAWLPCGGLPINIVTKPFMSRHINNSLIDISEDIGELGIIPEDGDIHNNFYYPPDYNPTQPLENVILGQGIVGEQAVLWAQMHHNPKTIISKDEIACIFMYTVESPFYKELNWVMRSGTKQEIQKYLDFIFYLSETLTKLPSFEGAVYRGIDCKTQYQVGKIIMWSGFSSATISPQLALSFLKSEEGTLFLINAKTAKRVSQFSPEMEDEVLFLPNTKFCIVSESSQAEKDILSVVLNVQCGSLNIYNLEEL